MKRYLIIIIIITCLLALISCERQDGQNSGDAEHTHSYSEWSVKTNPTCTEDGERIRTCGCGKVKTEPILAVGHSVVYDSSRNPDCTTSGLTQGSHCSVCNEVLAEQEIIEATGHNESDWVVIKEVTAEENGLIRIYCLNCGAILQEEIIYCDGSYNIILYTVNDDGETCTVIGISNCAGGRVEIEEEYDGFLVTAIGPYAFSGEPISEILLPDSIISIGDLAFYECASLKKVEGSLDKLAEIGEYAFAYCTSLEQLGMEEKVITVPETVYSLGICSFSGCNAIKSLTVDMVGEIQDSAFEECSNLSSIIISGNVTDIGYGAFRYCTSAEKIIIEDGVKSIGSYAFQNCPITEITLPDSITYVDMCIFYECNSLQSLTVPFIGRDIDQENASNTDYGRLEYLFEFYSYGGINTSVPQSLREITVTKDTVVTGNTFTDCAYIESVSLPDGVTSIGDWAFSGCASLKIINGGFDGLVTIGDYAFWYCTSLEQIGENEKVINIPATVTYFGSSAFSDCVMFETIDINMTGEIPNGAFSGCSGLIEITIPGSIDRIDSYAFSDCTSVERITIEDGVREIGENAFKNCIITEIIVPDSVTSIEGGAFYGCNNIEQVVLPFIGQSMDSNTYYDGKFSYVFNAFDKLWKITITKDTTIGNGAFSGLKFIKTIHFDSKIESIGESAFEGCDSLTTVECELDELRTIGDYAFFDCSSFETIGGENGVLTIPESTVYLGERAFFECNRLKKLNINMTGEIGSCAFMYCRGVTDILLSDSVTGIGDYAFYDCSITEIVVPDSVKVIGGDAFGNCDEIRKITLPFIGRVMDAEGDERYFGYIFTGCSMKPIDNLNIPESIREVIITQVTSVPETAFSSSRYIESVSFSREVTNIGNAAFAGCTSLKEINGDLGNVREIGRSAFSNCTSLEKIGYETEKLIIPRSVTYLGERAFQNCSKLSKPLEINIVGDIQSETFAGCSSIPEIYISGRVVNIKESAFEGCSSAKKISIADGVMEIDNYAFYKCTSAEDVTLSNTITTIGGYAFLNNSIKEIIIPDSVTHIGEGIFMGCNKIEKMILPFVGESIDAGCSDFIPFTGYKYYCSLGYLFNSYVGYPGSLNENVPESLRKVIITKDTSIGDCAFANCKYLDVVSLPAVVTSIGGSSFYNCEGLTNLYFGGTKSQWDNVSIAEGWNDGAENYYLHCNAFDYGLYFPSGAIRLPTTGRVYALYPLEASYEMKVLDVRTGDIISINDTNVKVQVASGGDNISIGSGYLSASSGGNASIIASYVTSDGRTVKIENPMPIFVAESSNFLLRSDFKFSVADRENIITCLDLYHSLYELNDIDETVEINMNIVENLLYGVSNLDDYLAGLIEGDLPKTAVLKKTFSELISNYIDSDYAHMMAVEDTQTILIGLEAIHEVYTECKDLTKFQTKLAKLIMDLDELYITAKLQGLSKAQVETLFNSLSMIIGYDEAMAEIMATDVWKKTLSHYNQDYDRYISAIKRVKSNEGLMENLFGGDHVVVLLYDNKPDTMELGMMTLDAVIYGMTDYSNNIELLQTIREQMLNCGYAPEDLEVHVIDELIDEYDHKWREAASNLISDIASETIVDIVTHHPALSVVKLASDIAMMFTPIDEKAEWLAMSCYREALKRCIYPISDLYYNGKLSMEKDKLMQFVSLYLYMQLEANELAYDIVSFLPSNDPDTIMDIVSLKTNISILNDVINLHIL